MIASSKVSIGARSKTLIMGLPATVSSGFGLVRVRVEPSRVTGGKNDDFHDGELLGRVLYEVRAAFRTRSLD